MGRVRRATVTILLLAAAVPAAGATSDSGDGRCEPPSAARDTDPGGAGLAPEADGAAWSGVNERHHLRVGVDAGGVVLRPLSSGHPSWEWRRTPVRLERGDAWIDLTPLRPRAEPDRIVLGGAALQEWVRSGPKGIEHGLTIPAAGGTGLVLVGYRLAGDLTPKVSADGTTVEYKDATGATVLIDRDLRALDADDREVEASWERVERRPDGTPQTNEDLRLVVQGDGHRHPLTILARLATPKGLARVATPSGRDARGASAPIAARIAPWITAGVPLNDQCGGAETIPGAGPFPYLSAVHDITDATTLGDPPLPSCQGNLSRSVWFRFMPAASGSYNLSLCSDGATATTVDDTVLVVYAASGDCVGLTEVAGGCDDDSCATGDLQSLLAGIDLDAGALYDIVAWQYGTAAPPDGAGALQLRVELNPPPGPAPPNDRCAGAEAIPGSGPFPYLSAVTADISGATTSGDPPTPSCQSNVSRSVWYAFTPAHSGRYSFSVCAAAPTATTVDDTVMTVYAGTGGCNGLTQLPGACDDDSCLVAASQSVIHGLDLQAGTDYRIVVWKYDLARPAVGHTALQLRVSEELAPSNDTCAGAGPLPEERAIAGTTVNAGDDLRLPAGAACFAGVGQTASTAAGGEVVFAYTAPRSGPVSFRVDGFEASRDAVLYVSADCPAGAPATVAGCLGAANRNAGYPGEEVTCLPLAAGQIVYAVVDEDTTSAGSPFLIEAAPCRRETEPNDLPAQAGAPICGMEGSIDPAGDIDFYALGAPPAGARLFALVNGAAANSTDFDLRVTTGTDTLEYDDLNDDIPFGALAPNLAGTPLPGTAAYLRVSHYSAAGRSEPYRLYAVLQPPAAAAAPETEPNDSVATATRAASHYLAGSLAGSGDVDLFAFEAAAGEVVPLGLDLDPRRDGTPFNGTLSLLDDRGTVLLSVNDPASASVLAPGTGSLTATTPASPAEAIVFRAPATATYYARVGWSAGTPGDYLLSIAPGCRGALLADADGDGVEDGHDCAPLDPLLWALPGEATDLRFASAVDPAALQWSAPAAPGAASLRYDLLRSPQTSDFTTATCLATDLGVTAAADTAIPATGVFFYLVRAENGCGGALGSGSDGAPRVGAACP
jgi:hypothetical protein